VPCSLVAGDDPGPVCWTVELCDQGRHDSGCLSAFRCRYTVGGIWSRTGSLPGRGRPSTPGTMRGTAEIAEFRRNAVVMFLPRGTVFRRKLGKRRGLERLHRILEYPLSH
jgi:hypothetical protein